MTKRFLIKKAAFALSLMLIVFWTVLGTGTSLAWFYDESDEVRNIFHFAEFEVGLSYRQEDGSYRSIEGNASIFDDEALYEPGYVQTVVMKVENKGEVPFNFRTAVFVTNYTLATNMFGIEYALQDYIRFGLCIDHDENALMEKIANRDLAVSLAELPLNDYSTEQLYLDAGKCAYIALIVRMPDDVNNMANHGGDRIPMVELGVIVNAEQIKK